MARGGAWAELAGHLMWAPLGLSRALPYRWRVAAMGWLTARGIAPLAGYRRRVRDNLSLIWPDLDAGAVQRITDQVCNNFGRQLAELVSPQRFADYVRHTQLTGPGLEALLEAQREGKQVIFITGHMGSFNAARVAMAGLGFELGVLYRPMHNEAFDRHYVRAMSRLSRPMFAQNRDGIRAMLRHLRAGGHLAIVADVRALDGEPLDFMGHPALTALTPAELALRHQALLVPVWGLRDPDGLHFQVVVEPAIPPSDAATMMRSFHTRLEARIKSHPGQWFWIHRRWRGAKSGHF